MILKQYYDALSVCATGKTVSIASYGGSTYNVTNSGASKLLQLYSGMGTVAEGQWATGVLFGGSDVVPNIKDNKLNSLISGLSGDAAVKTTVDSTNCLTTISSVLTITNGNDTDVTINEIGLNLNYTGNWAFLVDRTVLDAPLTIPAGGIGQVTYTIRMNYPTA